MEFQFLPNDMIREIVQYLPFEELITFGLVKLDYGKLIRETYWNHIAVEGFRYLIQGYHFRKWSVEIDRIARYKNLSDITTKYTRAISDLSKCNYVELRYTIIDSKIVRLLSRAKKIEFDRCLFMPLEKEDIQLLKNVKSISVDDCQLFPINITPELNISKFYSWHFMDGELRHLKNVKRIKLQSARDTIKPTDKGTQLLANTKEIDLYYSLPKTALMHLRNVQKLNLFNCHDITNDNLKDLDNVTDEALQYLNNIKVLDLMQLNITDNGLRYLKDNKDLSLSFCKKITDDGLVHLKNIKCLRLEDCTNITDDGYKHLGDVYELNLLRQPITNNGLKHLGNVMILYLRFCNNITNDGLAYLSNIYYLFLSHMHNITYAGLAHLNSLHIICTCFCNEITDECFEKVDNKIISLFTTVAPTNTRSEYIKNKFPQITIEPRENYYYYHLVKE